MGVGFLRFFVFVRFFSSFAFLVRRFLLGRFVMGGVVGGERFGVGGGVGAGGDALVFGGGGGGCGRFGG